MPLIELTDLKAHLNITDNASDAELTGYLDAAVDVAEGLVGPLRPVQVTEAHPAWQNGVVVLKQAPVVDVMSLTVRPYAGGTAVELDVADAVLDRPAGVLHLFGGYRYRGPLLVTYTAGQLNLPAAIKLAVLMIAKQMWETQRGAQPLPLQGAAAEPAAPDTYSPGIPERAQVLLDPFIRGPRVA